MLAPRRSLLKVIVLGDSGYVLIFMLTYNFLFFRIQVLDFCVLVYAFQGGKDIIDE